MSPKLELRQRLGLHHLAFFRAVRLDGLPLVESCARYLPQHRPTARVAARQLAWVESELRLEAQRAERRQFHKLLARGLPPAATAPPQPSLEEFAERHPGVDLSEADWLALLNEAHPVPPQVRREQRRRAAAIDRLRRFLAALEADAVKPPHPADPVAVWLPRPIAQPLATVNVATLGELTRRIQDRGVRWTQGVRGVGAAKARGVVDWLQAHVPGFREVVGPRARLASRALSRQLASVRPRRLGVVPFEVFDPGPRLSGADTPRRLPPGAGGLPAIDDRDAIARFLATKMTAEELRRGPLAPINHTVRAYRREIARLWQWAAIERGKALSALDEDDVMLYQTFLQDPQPRERWVGPRRPRAHPEWRPFTAPLVGAAVQLALAVGNALYSFWFEQGYVVRNPFRAGPKRPSFRRRQYRSRSLSLVALGHLREHLAALADDEASLRLRALLLVLYGTGIRRAELVGATLADLYAESTPEGTLEVELEVVGKGKVDRRVALPAPAVDAVAAYYAARTDGDGLPLLALGDARAALRQIPLFATLPDRAGRRRSLSASAVHLAVTALFRQVAQHIELSDPEAAYLLSRGSAHWLRHSFATHALDDDPGLLTDIQKALGHRSVNTTALHYLDEDRKRRQRLAQRIAQRAVL